MSPGALRTWIDGRESTTVPASDRGLQYGDGHFTTIACRNGTLRFRAGHLDRLRLACDRLQITFTAWAELEQELDRAASEAPLEALVKVIITRGYAVERGYSPTGREHARRIVTLWPTSFPTSATRAAGVCALEGEMRLGENRALAGIKHLNRLESIVARHEWTSPDISESLHATSSGQLACGTMSNVFLVGPDASLQTPVIELAGVAGIARSLVLRECAKLGIPCAAVALPRERLWEASGVFVTNVRLGIMPVTTLRTRAGHVKHLAVAPVVERLAAHLEGLDA